jgi:2-polyprenyl-6-methoxyphenol hydroxylase-like FAD-dependent oxidoreductase
MERVDATGYESRMGRHLRVGVVGCGVAGLASALILGRRGHQVTLIERAPSLDPVGAGLLLQPSGQMALGQMGLLDEVIVGAEPIEGLHALTHRKRTLVRLDYRRLDSELIGYGVHRGDLFEILRSHAARAGVGFELGKTIVGSRESGGSIEAIDDSGQAHGPFDVLIGADGARSRLRMHPDLGASVCEFPLGAAWFSGQSDAVRGRLHQVTRGSRQLIGMLPVGRGRCSLFCALPREGIAALGDGGLDSLKREIVALCPEAETLVAQIHEPGDMATARYQIVKLKRWARGRLVCIGDAAHSTTPHLGQGVNLALLDAVAISQALCEEGNMEAAILRACKFRKRLTMWSWRLSNLLGPVFQNEGWMLGMARDCLLPVLPHVPWVGKMMVGTMAGVRTGMFAGKLTVNNKRRG